MINLLNNDINTMSYKGCVEGFRILVHTIADSANTPLTVASHQPNYQNVDITIRNDNETVYDGDLATFVDYMLNREYLFKKSLRVSNLQMVNPSIPHPKDELTFATVVGLLALPMYQEHQAQYSTRHSYHEHWKPASRHQ